MVLAVIDADYIKYGASSAGEKRTIRVIHKKSGRENEFSNRTEFYGRGKKKDGGYLAEINKGRTSPFQLDEFEIIDVQTPDKIENVLHLSKMMMEKCIRSSQADSYISYLGKGDSFRVELSTILEYKGNRKDLLRPVYLDEVSEYLAREYKSEIITGIEADDQCVITCVENPSSVLIGVDKDYYGTPVNLLNPNRLDEGVVRCNQFGKLYRDEKGKVRGYGRLWLYHQICSKDDIDNYKANSASDKKWGEVSSYNALVDCKNDTEAWAAMKKVYQTLYPEPTQFKGWRGDMIDIDWAYMLEENFQMARMLRSMDEFENRIYAHDVLAKMDLL